MKTIINTEGSRIPKAIKKIGNKTTTPAKFKKRMTSGAFDGEAEHRLITLNEYLETQGKSKSLPEPFSRVFRNVSSSGRPTGEVLVVIDSPDDGENPITVLLDSAKLSMGNISELAALCNEHDLVKHQGAKGLRELSSTLLQEEKCFIYCPKTPGLHIVKSGNKYAKFLVWKDKLHKLEGALPFPIHPMCDQSAIAQTKYTLDDWNDNIGKHIVVNPYLLVIFCCALTSLVQRWLELPRLLLLILGGSSTGKTTALKIMQSLHRPVTGIQSATGTENGIRIFLEGFSDCPACLDELRQMGGDPSGLINIIFDTGNGASRLTSTTDRKLAVKADLTCGLILSNESSLADMLSGKRVQINEGIASRLFELHADAQFGMYHCLPSGLTAKQLSEQLNDACGEYCGEFWDAWVPAVAKKADTVKKYVQKNIALFEEKISDGLEIDNPVTKRMVSGLAAWATVGNVAARLKLFNATEAQIIKGFQLVLKEHVNRTSHNTTTVGQQVIDTVRDLLDRHTGSFPDIKTIHQGQSGNYGYRKVLRNETLYLIFPSVFTELVGRKFGTKMALNTLRQAQFLSTDKKGDQHQIRVPGISQLKRFYAVKESIRWDPQ